MIFVLIPVLVALCLALAVRQIARARRRQYRDEVTAFEFADRRQRYIRTRSIGPLASSLRALATRRRRINQAHTAPQSSSPGHQ
jgi:hypothetical protein